MITIIAALLSAYAGWLVGVLMTNKHYQQETYNYDSRK